MIEELLQCPCGHGISGHSGSGCEGERLRPCICRRTRGDVLEMAIADVRTDTAFSKETEPLPHYVRRIATR